MSDSKYDEDAEHVLLALEEVEETIEVMGTVVSQLKEQLLAKMESETVEMSFEDYLQECTNQNGVLH